MVHGSSVFWSFPCQVSSQKTQFYCIYIPPQDLLLNYLVPEAVSLLQFWYLCMQYHESANIHFIHFIVPSLLYDHVLCSFDCVKGLRVERVCNQLNKLIAKEIVAEERP